MSLSSFIEMLIEAEKESQASQNQCFSEAVRDSIRALVLRELGLLENQSYPDRIDRVLTKIIDDLKANQRFGFADFDEGSIAHTTFTTFRKLFNEWISTPDSQTALARQFAKAFGASGSSLGGEEGAELLAFRNARNQIIDLLKRKGVIPQGTAYDVHAQAAVNAIAQLVDKLDQYRNGYEKANAELQSIKQSLLTLAGGNSSLGGEEGPSWDEDLDDDYDPEQPDHN